MSHLSSLFLSFIFSLLFAFLSCLVFFLLHLLLHSCLVSSYPVLSCFVFFRLSSSVFFSLPLCPCLLSLSLSLTLSLFLSLFRVVLWCVVLWCVCGVVCGVVCVVWHRENPVCPLKTSPCVRSKRPRVCRHHEHMCFNMAGQRQPNTTRLQVPRRSC